jgi:hypothetical protein
LLPNSSAPPHSRYNPNDFTTGSHYHYGMGSDAPPAVVVLLRALMVAQNAAASEITITHVLTAIDGPYAAPERFASTPSRPFVPVERQELPLSPGAASVISSLGDLSSISIEALRPALLAAKDQGLE